MTKNQLYGYLFERFCRMLFESAGFSVLKHDGVKVKHEGTSGYNVIMCGRGTWHQIDLPFEFQYPVPFVNPIRVIGEVKYLRSKISKNYIRSFIGVVKDISENYITYNVIDQRNLIERTLDQAVFVSKSAFQLEAQKLANAHNIKLITIDNNPVLRRLFRSFVRQEESIRGHTTENNNTNEKVSEETFNKSQLAMIDKIFNENIKSYFLGTSCTGHLLYFVSDQEFNFAEYSDNGILNAYITYPTVKSELTGTIKLHIGDVIFYTTLPKLVLDEFQNEHNKFGNAIQSKYNHFRSLTVYIKDVNDQLKVYSIQFNSEMR